MREAQGTERQRIMQRLANYPLLDRASDTSVEKVLASASYWVAMPGERLLQEGTPASQVFFVLSGATRIFHSADDGREFTPKMMAAPNHFGDLELVAGHTINGQSVETLEESLVATLPGTLLRELLATDHGLCFAWLQGLASQFVFTIDADRHNVFLGVGGRVANVLLSYAQLYGRKSASGEVVLDGGVSRDRLARHVGSVRRVIIRLLQDWGKRGWVQAGERGLSIKNLEAVAALTLPRRLGLSHRAGERAR